MLRKNWPIMGILGLGLALRLPGLQGRPLSYDEAFSYFLSVQPLPKIIQATAADTMPPLYYFLLHFWSELGKSVWLLRGLNVLLSLGVIYLAYRIVSELFNSTAGAWASVFTAVSPFQIYYAQEMRMYALLALACLGYLWCFIRLYQEDKPSKQSWRNYAGIWFFGTAALYTHNLAGFTLLVPAVFLLFYRRWRLLGRLTLVNLMVGAAFIPWLLFVPGQVQKIQAAFWTPRPGIIEILQVIISFVTNLPLPTWGVVTAAIISLQILVISLLEIYRNRWIDPETVLLISTTAVPGLILFGISYLMRPVFVPRVLIASAVAGYGLLGRVAASGSNRIVGVFAGGIFIAAALAALPYQVLFNEFPRSPYQQAVGWLKTTPAGTAVLHENKLSYFPMRFYAPDLRQEFIADMPGTPNDTLSPVSAAAMGLEPASDAASAAGESNRVEYVIFETELEELKKLGISRPPALEWLEGHYQPGPTRAFGDLLIMEFTHQG